MKANEAPERIWINSPQDLPCSSVDSNSIEYTRTDAFIEKASEWIRNNYLLYPSEDCADTKKFVMGFKNYMKGE